MVRKTIIAILGFSFIILGVAMIVLPGPAIVFIPLGVAILALEFEWAQRLLEWMKAKIRGRRSRDKQDTP